ncbi:restriction endonuclease subunit S [Cloacibacterium normanense]|uniref:restriction endonuclease subunit S n=1 Tax=Cloacibacterium normanense TaxID=237258 RepID=UPI003918BC68
MSDLVSTFNQKNAPYFLDENWIWYYWKDIISSYQQGLIRSNSELIEIDGIDYFKMNFINENGTYTFNGLPKTFATSEEIDNYKIKNGDFFINVRNSKELVGKSCVVYDVNKNILFNHMLVRINHKEYVTGSFINAYFNTKFGKKLIETCKKGTTTVIALYQKDLYNIPIPIPKKKILEGIDEIYNSINKKIELNNRINAELEAMAKTLYDYWFVQFDFPNVENKPYKTSGGKMLYNETLKREIPEGWEVKKLYEIANITMGQSPNGESYNEENNGMIFFQGSTDFGWRFPTNRMYTTSPTRFAQEDDVLLSVRAPIGTMNIAMEDCCIGRGLAAINSKDGFSSYLTYQMNNFKKKFDYLNSVGTTFGSLTKDELYNLELPYPSESILKNFEAKIQIYDKKIKNNSKQNQELSALRDWLLPMLMNGQVKVG